MSYETDLQQFDEDPGISRRDTGPSSAEVEVWKRRELALTATSAVSEVLEVDVTPDTLLQLADTSDAKDVRLAAVRALRCIEAIGREDSEVVAMVGEKAIYHFVEGVIQYGASTTYYLGLMGVHGLNAEETTALYDLREQISDYTNGSKPGFKKMTDALRSIGIEVHDAVKDPEAAVQALDEAGYFVDHVGNSEFGRAYARPIFAPVLAASSVRLVEHDPDGSISRGILEASRTQPHPEEIED